MTPAFRLFGLILLVATALSVVGILILIQSTVALQHGHELPASELLPIAVMNVLVRYLPWALLPLLLAPAAAPIVWWLYGRHRGVGVPGGQHRAQLGRWLVGVALALVPPSAVVTLGLLLREPGLFGCAVFGAGPVWWALTGASYCGLNVQHKRHLAGRSRVPAMVLGILLLVCGALDRLGVTTCVALTIVWWRWGRDSQFAETAQEA